MNVKQSQHEVVRLQTIFGTKQRDMEKMTENANVFMQKGEEARARYCQIQIMKLTEEIALLEERILLNEKILHDKQQRIRDIDARIKQLKEDHKRVIHDLEEEKIQLTGGKTRWF